MTALSIPAIGQMVTLDAVPVHAPSAPMRRGAPVQILRVGAVYDQMDGELVIDVTDEMCAALVASAGAAGFGVPIDHGHTLIRRQMDGAAHDDVQVYGRVAALDHRPGLGVWATPDWNDHGAGYVASNPGTLFISPTLQPAGFDPRTGAKVAGRILHSVSITPTPRQDSLDSLALDRAATGAPPRKDVPMSGSQNGGGQTPPDDVVTLQRVAHNTLLARVTDAESKAAASAAEVTTLAAQLADRDADVVTLASRIGAMEVERAGDKLAAVIAGEVSAAEKKGYIVTPAVRAIMAKLPDAADRVTYLASLAVRPTVLVGHSETPQVIDPNDPATIRKAVALARENKIDFGAAMTLATGGGVT